MSLRIQVLTFGVAVLLGPSVAVAQYGNNNNNPMPGGGQQQQIPPGQPAPPAPPAPPAVNGFNPYQGYGQQGQGGGQYNNQGGQYNNQQGQGNGQQGQNNNQASKPAPSNPYQPSSGYVPKERPYHLAQRDAMVMGLSKLNPFVFYPAPEDVVSIRRSMEERQVQALIQAVNGSPQAAWIACQLT